MIVCGFPGAAATADSQGVPLDQRCEGFEKSAHSLGRMTGHCRISIGKGKFGKGIVGKRNVELASSVLHACITGKGFWRETKRRGRSPDSFPILAAHHSCFILSCSRAGNPECHSSRGLYASSDLNQRKKKEKIPS